MDESLFVMKGDISRAVATSLLNGYIKMSEKMTASAHCDWNDYPEVTQPKYRSIELLLFEAGKNVFGAALKPAKEANSGSYKQEA